MRRFVVIGQRATASPDFSLNDIPSSSGRLDVLLRCLRASLLVSHGLRRDTSVALVLMGGPSAPRVLRLDGASASFVRPDERSLAALVKNSLAAFDALGARARGEFAAVRAGVEVACGGLDEALGDAARGPLFVLEEGGHDVRDAALDPAEVTLVVGDHLGFDAATRARLAALGAVALSVGPVSVHADDAVAAVVNELDRRAARG